MTSHTQKQWSDLMTPQRWADLFSAAGIQDVEDVKFAYIQGPCVIPDPEKPGEFIVFISAEQHNERWETDGFWEDVQRRLRPYPTWQI